MIRCFVAIPPAKPVVDGVGGLQKELKTFGLEATYPASGGVHLTLKFLGDVDEPRVPELGAALRRASSGCPKLPLSVAGVGAFPRISDPRVVWLGIDGGPELLELQLRLEHELSTLGFAREERRFHPHVTVARVKSRRNVAHLIRWLETAKPRFDSFVAEECHLYQSILRPEGAQYRILESASF